MGDEVVLIYEATGRVVRPGGLPIEQGVAVFNVETLYNVYRAVEEHKPVTCKYVSVVAEVENPVTVKSSAGMYTGRGCCPGRRYNCKGSCIFRWRPDDGTYRKWFRSGYKNNECNPGSSKRPCYCMKKQRTSSIDLKRAASICCHCHTCTDLCPRHNLGHPIDPAMFMMAASKSGFQRCKSLYRFCILQFLRCM